MRRGCAGRRGSTVYLRDVGSIQLGTRVAVTRFELEASACGVAMPVFGPGGDVLAAIELTVRDLGATLQPVLPALTIAARSLSRELARQPRQPRTGEPRRTPDTLPVAAAGS